MRTTQNSSTGAEFPKNHRPDMTLERILLAYLTSQPLGVTSYLTGEESLEEAHEDVLCDLMTAQRQLEKFREQLLLLMSPTRLPSGSPRKALQVGHLMRITMLALDELKVEINTFLEADKSHDQT